LPVSGSALDERILIWHGASTRLLELVFTPRKGTRMARKKILLVDDSSTVLLFEKMVLSKEPYDLIVAKDGREGVEKALAERPHLILMDVTMPRMDGVEACRQIRARGETAGIPVILVTTHGEPESVASGRAAGCNDHITKPISAADLLFKIRSHLAA
jgi:CheY-like chemotaxis protein